MTQKRDSAGSAVQKNTKPSNTRLIVLGAMFAALVLLATSVLKIQTPTFGYIHIGDAFVLLAGLFLGPAAGGLAAGIGSALSDLLGGYAMWVPGTFVIKFLTAAAAAQIFRLLQHDDPAGQAGRQSSAAGGTGQPQARRSRISSPVAVIAAGIVGELIMVVGYFLFNVLIIAFSGGGFSGPEILSAFSLSLAEIPFNVVQGVTGIVLAVLLQPVFARIQKTSVVRTV